MKCHCNDHVPGDWNSGRGCDCHEHEHPTYTFVVTKVMEEDPGTGTAYISSTYMELLQVGDGDPVEILDGEGCVVQARSHPNPWIDTRMISLDRQTMDKIGCQLFSQIKLRKTCCHESERVVLQVPAGVSITRLQLQAMLEQTDGAIINDGDSVTLKNNRGESIQFRVVEAEPADIARISHHTQIDLLDEHGEPYVARHETTFKDVGGLSDAIGKVREIVQLPLKHPEIFFRLGIDPPRGVLLHGPSGTGKTLIARAVAGETGCYFKAISGTEIMDKHYGESEAKLRNAFEDAYNNAPAIMFVDEVDALAPARDTAEGEVERRITAQLLALMDGLEDRGNIVVLAATNLPNVLDTALRRPGRFDREVLIGVPDKDGRREILEIHTRFMPLGDVDLADVADRIHGFVGADIKALCQEAGYKALKRLLPGIEDTDEPLTDDFLQEITVETEDFEAALREMNPSSARSFEVDLRRAGWDRVAGYKREIDFIREFVLWPLNNIQYLTDIGVDHISALLVTGPSGVGKTLIARTLAKESGFNVIEIRGPELISKYMGESERNIRELFRKARQMAPAVVILDGIEAMTSSGWSDNKVMDRVVNQLVQEMNAITGETPILAVAVANRADDLPPALRATGKFATELPIPMPRHEDRKELFEMHLTKERVTCNVDFDKAAAESEGLTGGDIAEVCRRVILQSARCALDDGGDKNCSVTVNQEDVAKMLERWRLTSGTGFGP